MAVPGGRRLSCGRTCIREVSIAILAIDQGTTGTTAALFDRRGRIVDRAYRRLEQIYPRPGWVEHDPLEIWGTVREAVEEVLERHGEPVDAVGITNQRETTIVWEADTGRPIHNAIVWQCRRTSDMCDDLAEHAGLFRDRTGLPLDAYFSGTKIAWLLDNVAVDDPAALRFGTVDSWLIWRLTGGTVHATDFTNASRTLLFDIHRRCWDEELCDLLGVPTGLLPAVKRSIGDYGTADAVEPLAGVPIAGVSGDQHAALFGQACFDPGQAKNTYGTGCFLLMNTGDEAVASDRGLVTTLAVDAAGEPCYALEGSVFVAGAAIQWLAEGLELLEEAGESDAVARSVPDNGGVYLVPAFTGLGAPHWAMRARGLITGLTRGVGRAHVVRAALESIAYQSLDVLEAMEADAPLEAPALHVDGGAAANDFLLQFQADVLARPVRRSEVIEATSLGAAYLAGLGVGFWPDAAELRDLGIVEREFVPTMGEEERAELLDGWRRAIRQALTR